MAAFSQSNEGDVSPNIVGARCLDTGEECDQITSTCNGKVSVSGHSVHISYDSVQYGRILLWNNNVVHG